jgi:hypothetical protein
MSSDSSTSTLDINLNLDLDVETYLQPDCPIVVKKDKKPKLNAKQLLLQTFGFWFTQQLSLSHDDKLRAYDFLQINNPDVSVQIDTFNSFIDSVKVQQLELKLFVNANKPKPVKPVKKPKTKTSKNQNIASLVDAATNTENVNEEPTADNIINEAVNVSDDTRVLTNDIDIDDIDNDIDNDSVNDNVNDDDNDSVNDSVNDDESVLSQFNSVPPISIPTPSPTPAPTPTPIPAPIINNKEKPTTEKKNKKSKTVSIAA